MRSGPAGKSTSRKRSRAASCGCSATPACLGIRTELEWRIRSGALPPGARLPTEAELRQQFSASVVPAEDADVELPGVADDAPVNQLLRLKFDVDENPSFAWTNSHNKNPRPYHDLNVARARRARRDRRRDAELADPHRKSGMGRGRGGSRAAVRFGRRAHRPRLPRRLDHPATSPRAGPRLARTAKCQGNRPLPTEGHVIPALLVARLWGEARDHHAELRCPAAISRASEVDGGFTSSSPTAPSRSMRW